MTTKGMAIIALLLATPALQGCDLFDNAMKVINPSDPVNAMKANSGPYTAGSAVVEEIIVAEQTPVPEPPCEGIRWRYRIYTCDWVDTGRTYE
jgi:hypothetical protein